MHLIALARFEFHSVHDHLFSVLSRTGVFSLVRVTLLRLVGVVIRLTGELLRLIGDLALNCTLLEVSTILFNPSSANFLSMTCLMIIFKSTCEKEVCSKGSSCFSRICFLSKCACLIQGQF